MCDRPDHSARDGFTLIEVMIAMALFALIAVAGFTLLDSVLRTQSATETRLARLAQVQRAMLVVSTDLDQITGALAGGGASMTLQKDDLSGGRVIVRYDLNGTTLTRTVSGPLGERSQPLIADVTGLRWSFHRRRGEWLETWPQAAIVAVPPLPVATPTQNSTTGAATLIAPTTKPAPDGVTAVAVDVTLSGLDDRPGATLRRVVSIPLMEATPAPAPVSPVGAPS